MLLLFGNDFIFINNVRGDFEIERLEPLLNKSERNLRGAIIIETRNH